jgi:ribosomal protein S18 acetylase RimI-like enzyme
VIRPGTAADVGGVLALWGAERSAHAVTDDTPEALLRALDALLVAEADGAIVGAVLAASDGWRGNFYRLAVRPSHRRRGLGLALVRAGEERLRGLGIPRITALVAFDDEDARAFWRTAGNAADAEMGRMVRSLPK